jgi:hypothetical protein
MDKIAPFSITPDAEDYIRNRLSVMPPEVEPVIMMATKLGEPLDTRGKKTRWFYEGENFEVGYFVQSEKPQAEQIELLGRNFSITPEALKHLSGKTLALRRVKPAYGLMNVQRYVLVADSASEPPSSIFDAEDSTEKTKRIFSIGALTVLGGFTGIGVIWIVIAELINFRIVKNGDEALSSVFPFLIFGWIVGAIVSFFFFRKVYGQKGKTKFVQEQMQRKYVGYGGLNNQLNWWIFLGIPTPLTIALVMFLEHFARTVGEKTTVVFAAIMVVFVPAMYFCDRIKHRIVTWFGLLGWALTIAGLYWYFKTYGH